MKNTFVTLLAFFLFQQISLADSTFKIKSVDSDSSAIIPVLNLAYGNAADDRNLIDIFLPKGHTKKTKLVVFIHGGFWTKGNKGQLPKPFVALLTSKNYAVASINYRLVKPKAQKYPIPLEDVNEALAFLSAKADSIGYKKNSFALMGASAGAHLALMQTYLNNSNHSVKTVIDIVGPTDLTDSVVRGRQGIADATISYFLGESDRKAKIATDASPLFQLTKKNAVPTIIFHGENDELVDVLQAKKLHQKLQAMGVKTQLVLYPNETHEMRKSLPDVFIKTAAWLEKVYPTK